MTRGATDLSRTHLHTPQVESGLGIGRMVGSRFAMAGEQLKAKGVLEKALIPDASDPAYVVALNLISRYPHG